MCLADHQAKTHEGKNDVTGQVSDKGHSRGGPEGKVDGHKDGQMGRPDGQMGGEKDGKMGKPEGQMDEQMDRQMGRPKGQRGGQKDGQMDKKEGSDIGNSRRRDCADPEEKVVVQELRKRKVSKWER